MFTENLILFILVESVLQRGISIKYNVVTYLIVVIYSKTVYTVTNKPSPIQWVGFYRIHNINIH